MKQCFLDIGSSYTYELTMSGTAYVNPVQFQARPNPRMARVSVHTIPSLATELLAIVSYYEMTTL